MGLPDPNLQAAISEALTESKYETDEMRDEADPYDVGPEAAAAADGDESSTDAPVVEDEAASEDDESQELDIPEFYRKELEGLPKEQAKAILDHLQQQDSYISTLQARLAKPPDAPATPTEDIPADEVTDEALASALGYDPEDQYNQPTAAELKLARTVLSMEDKLESMAQKETVREVEISWNKALDDAEDTYGKLPFSRVEVLRYAVEEGLASPFETYFRLSAPAKKEVDTLVSNARQAAAKKAEGGGVKPRSSASSSAVIDPKTTSLRDATRIAMAEAEKETGLSFKSIFGRKVKVDE